jgi:hypothetical protein
MISHTAELSLPAAQSANFPAAQSMQSSVSSEAAELSLPASQSVHAACPVTAWCCLADIPPGRCPAKSVHNALADI